MSEEEMKFEVMKAVKQSDLALARAIANSYFYQLYKDMQGNWQCLFITHGDTHGR